LFSLMEELVNAIYGGLLVPQHEGRANIPAFL
jgi:hypothetical protein